MSALHSPRAPWLMLLLFCAATAAFFLLAAGRDLALLPDALTQDQKKPAQSKVSKIRQAIVREEQKIVRAEKKALHGIGEMLEHAGRKIEGLAGVGPEELAPSPDQEIPGPEVPGKLLSHRFAVLDKGFKAEFDTDRPVPEPKIFFMSSPALWAVDIPGKWSNASPRINTTKQGEIRRVVIGEHEDYLRLVFLYHDAELPRPEMKPEFKRTEGGFAVFVPASSPS